MLTSLIASRSPSGPAEPSPIDSPRHNASDSMSHPQTTCDPRRIQECLADSLSEDELAALEAHLEGCAACRESLEQAAARPGDWQSARDFLSSDASLPLPFKKCGDERASVITSLHHPHDRSANAEEIEPATCEPVDDVLSALAP